MRKTSKGLEIGEQEKEEKKRFGGRGKWEN
jgi:hypothetical protein